MHVVREVGRIRNVLLRMVRPLTVVVSVTGASSVAASLSGGVICGAGGVVDAAAVDGRVIT